MPDFDGIIYIGKEPTKKDFDNNASEDFLKMLNNQSPDKILSPGQLEFQEVAAMDSRYAAAYAASLDSYDYLTKLEREKKLNQIGVFGIDFETIQGVDGQDLALTMGVETRELNVGADGKLNYSDLYHTSKDSFNTRQKTKPDMVKQYVVRNKDTNAAMDLYRERLGFDKNYNVVGKLGVLPGEEHFLQSIWGLANESTPLDYSKIIDSNGQLSQAYRDPMANAFRYFYAQPQDKIEEQFMKHLLPGNGKKYSDFFIMGHNVYGFDNRLLRPIIGNKIDQAAVHIIDSLALMENMKDQVKIYDSLSGGRRVAYRGHSLEALRDIMTGWDIKGASHVASVDTKVEGIAQGVMASFMEPSVRGQYFTQQGKRTRYQKMASRGALTAGSSVDGAYEFSGGQWKRIYGTSKYPVSRGKIYQPMLKGGQDIFQYKLGDATYYGTMLKNFSEDRYHLVSRGTREELVDAIRSNFVRYKSTTGGLKRMRPVGNAKKFFSATESRTVQGYQDLARRRFEGMFRASSPSSAWNNFESMLGMYWKVATPQAVGEYGLYERLRAGITNPIDIDNAVKELQMVAGLERKSATQLRDLAVMFPRLAAESPALQTLYETLSTKVGGGLGKDVAGDVLALLYSDAVTAAGKNAAVGFKPLFSSNNPGIFLFNRAGRTYSSAFTESRASLASAIRGIGNAGGSYHPEQMTNVAYMVEDLFSRARKTFPGPGAVNKGLRRSMRAAEADIRGYLNNGNPKYATYVADRILSLNEEIKSAGYDQGLFGMTAIEQRGSTLGGYHLPSKILDVGSTNTLFDFGTKAGIANNAEDVINGAIMRRTLTRGITSMTPLEDATSVLTSNPYYLSALERSQASIERKKRLFSNYVSPTFTTSPIAHQSTHNIDSVALDAVKKIAGEIRGTGGPDDPHAAVTFMLDNKRNSINLLVYSNKVSQELMVKHQSTGVAGLAKDPNVLNISIPLDDMGFYFNNSYKANPIMLRVKDKADPSRIKDAAEAIKGAAKNPLKMQYAIDKFNDVIDITDARTLVLDKATKNIKSVMRTFWKDGAAAAQTQFRKSLTHEVMEIMPLGFIKADSSMAMRARESIAVNSARVDVSGLIKVLTGKDISKDFFSEKETRETFSTVDAFLNRQLGSASILSNGTRLSAGNKVEQVTGGVMMLQHVSRFVPFGVFAPSGREEMYQWTNYKPFDSSRINSYIKKNKGSGLLSNRLITESQKDVIAGEMASINIGTLTADDAVLAQAIERVRANGDPNVVKKLRNWSVEEGMGLTRKSIQDLATLDTVRSITFDEGFSPDVKVGDTINGYLSKKKNNSWGTLNGEARKYSGARDVKVSSIEYLDDGSTRISYAERTPGAGYVRKFSVNGGQKITSRAVDDDVFDALVTAMGFQPAQVASIFGSKVYKKSDWNTILVSVTQQMFNEARKSKTDAEIIKLANEAFIQNFVESAEGKDYFRANPVFKGSVGNIGDYINPIVMSDWQAKREAMNYVGSQNMVGSINNFYSAVTGAAEGPIRTAGGYAVMQGISQFRISNIEDYDRVWGNNIREPGAGVKFTLRNFEALDETDIVINGQRYGGGGYLSKWFSQQFNPTDARYYSSKNVGMLEAEKTYFATRMIQAEVLSGRTTAAEISQTDWYKKRFGDAAIETKSWKDLSYFGDMTKIDRMATNRTIFDTGKQGMMVELPEAVNGVTHYYAGNSLNQGNVGERYIAEGEMGGHVKATNPFVNLDARAQSILSEYQRGMNEAKSMEDVERVRNRYQSRMGAVIEQSHKTAIDDLFGSRGKYVETIAGGRLPHSGSFTLAASKSDDVGAAGIMYINEKSATEMLRGLDKADQRSILAMMRSEDAAQGIAGIGIRHPTISATSQLNMMVKIDNNLASNEVRLSRAATEMLRGDFDGDHLFMILPFMNAYAGVKKAQRGEKWASYSDMLAGAQQFWAENGGKSAAEVDAALNAIGEANPLVAAMYDWQGKQITERARETKLTRILAENHVSFLGGDPANLKFGTTIEAQDLMERISKEWKGISVVSNANTRVRRLLANVEGASGELLDQVAGAGIALNRLEVVGDVLKHLTTTTEQNAFAQLNKRIGEVIGGDNVQDRLKEVSGAIGELIEGTRNSDIDVITGAFGKLNANSNKPVFDILFGGGAGGEKSLVFGYLSKYGELAEDNEQRVFFDKFLANMRDNPEAVFTEGARARKQLQALTGGTAKQQDALNAFLSLNPRNFEQSLDIQEAILDAGREGRPIRGSTKYLLDWANNMGRTDIVQAIEEGRDRDIASMVGMLTDDTLKQSTRNVWQTGAAASEVAEKIGHGINFKVGGLASGLAAFGAAWAVSGALRGSPTDTQLGQGDTAPMSTDGKYLDPSMLPPAPRGSGLPTARIMMDGDVASQLKISMTGKLSGRNKVAAEDLLYSLQSQFQGLGVSADIRLNNNDRSTQASRMDTQNLLNNYTKSGYAYRTR